MSTENNNRKNLADSLKEVVGQTNELGKSAGNALDKAFDAMRELLSEEDFVKWEELNARMLSARLAGDMDKVASLEKDVSELFDKPIEEEK